MTLPAALLEARSVTKRFGRLTALDAVDLDLRAGEVHALIGENGAGKSTLMGILYGVHAPDAGSIAVEGTPVRFAQCADAMRAGIGMVFQHFLLVDRFTVAQNVLLGREPRRGAFVDRAASDESVRTTAARYGFALDPRARVEDLGVGSRQQVELLKVLERDARIVILDEPTASLSPFEARALMDVIRRLRSEGRAVAFVSHKLREVLEIADRITVLRAGRVVGSMAATDADESTLAALMVGRPIGAGARIASSSARRDAAIDVDGLRVLGDDGAEAVRGISLSAAGGEIVCIAGVEGNGQREFAEALYGLRAPASGRIALDGVDVMRMPTTRRRALGMRYIPADRMREGLVLEFDARENALLGDQRRRNSPLLDDREAAARAADISARFGLTRAQPGQPVATFSGGMQQKLIAGRELREGAKAVIAFSPTRGVDVGAAEAIHERLRAVRDSGAAVIVVSFDLDEIRALADRIVVFSSGSVAGEIAPDAASDEALGRLMGGVASHA